MTVKELIEQLSKCNPNLEVIINDGREGCFVVREVKVITNVFTSDEHFKEAIEIM